jgi:2-amino-4-hydroxy-6-hydroxymethyldihydropteridine diphosphokinase
MNEGRWALFLLGGDLGDPRYFLDRAEALLGEAFGQVPLRSRDHWTEPWGFTDHRLFLNRAVLVRSELGPEELMAVALDVERQLGRERHASAGYAPRTIDIDLLLLEDMVHQGPLATVPHPRLHQRAFALAPAADLCPEWVHPARERTMVQLLNDLLVE